MPNFAPICWRWCFAREALWIKLVHITRYPPFPHWVATIQIGKKMKKPVIKQDPLYQLLRNEDIDGFNAQRDSLETSELKSGDYRGRDLRKMNADGLDFSNSYFRNSDLSGIDFRNTNLEGASLLGSKLSGVYFPSELSAEEIRLSRDTGTRMRYSK